MTKGEIIAALAQRCGATQSAARQFYEALNEMVMEGLRSEQMVKIKGLGTFKTVSVKARKSVSVNGGEEIEIPAHDKVAFTAEKGFAELVNEPLAHLEVVDLDDASEENVHEEPSDNYILSARMKKLGDEAEALKGLLADINGVTPVGTTQASSPSVTMEQLPVETTHASSLLDTTDQPSERKTTHGGMLARIFICILLLLLVGFGVFYWVKFSDDEVSIEENKPVVAQTIKTEPQKEEFVETTEPGMKEEVVSNPTIDELRKIKVDYSQTIGTETVRSGSRLTMISLRAFGNKDFWIYIYLANRDQLSSPGMIRTGMIIKIPKLDSRLTDASNPDCLKLAKELEAKYVK